MGGRQRKTPGFPRVALGAKERSTGPANDATFLPKAIKVVPKGRLTDGDADAGETSSQCLQTLLTFVSDSPEFDLGRAEALPNG